MTEKKRKRSTRQGEERKKKYEAGPRASEQKKNYEAGPGIKNLSGKKGAKRYEAGPKNNDFSKKKKKRKKNLTEANGRCNNERVLAGRRFLTRKLATCSRYTVKTNTKRTRPVSPELNNNIY